MDHNNSIYEAIDTIDKKLGHMLRADDPFTVYGLQSSLKGMGGAIHTMSGFDVHVFAFAAKPVDFRIHIQKLMDLIAEESTVEDSKLFEILLEKGVVTMKDNRHVIKEEIDPKAQDKMDDFAKKMGLDDSASTQS